MKSNDIVLDIPTDRIIIAKKHIIDYKTSSDRLSLNHNVRRSQSFLLRANQKKVLFPGEFVELQAPSELERDAEISLEPCCDSLCTSYN